MNEAFSVNVLTFNAWNSLVRFPEGPRIVAEIIRENAIDVAGFQEISPDTLVEITRHLGQPYNACAEAFAITKHTIDGVYECKGRARVYGACLRLAPQFKIRVFNSHLQAYPYGPYMQRDGASQEDVLKATQETQCYGAGAEDGLVQGLDRLVDHSDCDPTLPTILVGDHNIPSHLDHTPHACEDASYALARGFPPRVTAWPVSAAMYRRHFVDSYREVNSDVCECPGFTWTCGDLQGFKSPNEVHDRIDFVYYRSGAQWVGKTVSSQVIDSANGGQSLWCSDHRAVMSRIEFQRST